MKTDYARLGRESLEHFEATAKRAGEEQEKFLLHWIQENRDTEFGRRHGFGDIASVEDYRAKVPLSTYLDYARDIERMIAGEKNILTAREAIFFCMSSGTVGVEKYLPLTDYDLESHYTYGYGMILGQVRKYYKDLPEEEVFGKIFEICEFAKTYMPDGRMKGVRTSGLFQWLDETDGFDASDYCVPKEILFPSVLEDMTYVKVRFALAERNLKAIHGVFINRTAGVMEYILRNWELLLRDMEQGTVSVELDEKWRRLLLEKLPPDPQRAQELRSISGLSSGIVRKIWKNMRYIMSIGGENYAYFTEKMRKYAGDVPIHFYGYGASEGVFGISEDVDLVDRYVLLPDSVFFEFLPVDEETGETLLLGDLETGRKYEMVITNRAGLYRYCLGDVLEVVGWHETTPVVKFCYRRNQVLNIAGEKSNQQQLDDAVQSFAQRTRSEVIGYAVQEDMTQGAPRYLFYMECSKIPAAAESVFEECLCAANPDYKACLNMREIGPLRIEFLREGSFELYAQLQAQSGKSIAQSKPLRFLDTEEKRAFFAAQILTKGD